MPDPEGSSSFVLKVPVRYDAKIRDVNFWPADTYVNRYYFPKNKQAATVQDFPKT